MKKQAGELLDKLLATYPETFSREQENIRPLAVGIHAELLPWTVSLGYSAAALRKALTNYCRRPCYLKALAERRERVALSGGGRGRVSKTHARGAREKLESILLARRQARGAERKNVHEKPVE